MTPRRSQVKSAFGPRALAITVLSRVAATDAYLNVVLDSTLDEFKPADPRDAGLVTELCYGTMRRLLRIDAELRRHSDRRLETLEDKVLSALRIGAYQHLYLRVPTHAAVSDTVEALKSLRMERATGFVNAVLRKVVSAPPAEVPADPIAALALRESHPEWLLRRWVRQFGAARAEAMAVANNVSPAVTVRVNSSKGTRDELLAQLADVGIEARATTVSPVGIVLEHPGRVDDVFGYDEGSWQVQDEAAQLVTRYAHVPAQARVLDVCAAPGGKACHLAETNSVVATDLYPAKLKKIETEARRLGVLNRLKVRPHDATTPFPEGWGEFDAVVVDAPCSGTGTLRRHPELRYRRAEADFAELCALQRSILENAQQLVAPGGLLVYAVCSIDSSEGADQVEMFLRSHPDFTTEPPPDSAAFPTWQGHLRTLPGLEGLDGFFAARLRKMY